MQGQPLCAEKGCVTELDTIGSIKTEADLRGELDRLKSRLAQGQRDHQRSRDELRRLAGEIRQIEGELRAVDGGPQSQ
jgi:chromosome segregation ATPase